MRVGLRLFYNQSWLGGVNYVLNIARMLRELPEGERPEVVFLTATPEANEIALQHRDLADEISQFDRAGELGLDFVFPATQIAEAPFQAPWGGWIPDWQCEHYPELFAPEERARRFLQYRTLAEGPAVCIFSSQQAIDDTRRILGPEPGAALRVFRFPAVIDRERYRRAPGQLAATRAKLGVPESYLIVCNQFWKHKNHLVVAEALALASDLNVHVVMTGAMEDERWPDYATKVRETLAQPAVASRVTLTGKIDRVDQVDLMIGAAGIIQPSLFEGWSTFVEEARALGIPSLLSDIPVHREQSPPGCAFFNPLDPEELAARLRDFAGREPQPRDMAAIEMRHRGYVAACARVFMGIAHDCAARFDPTQHESVAILARQLPRIRTEAAAGGGVRPFGKGDYDRYLANIRSMLRSSPESLARLAGHLCDEANPYADDAINLIVLATLAKATPEQRRRFMEYQPDDVGNLGVWAGIAQAKRAANNPTAQGRHIVAQALSRAREFVRRKLPPK